MADQQQTTPSNGATPPEPRPSLRDVAEAAWDQVQEAADDGGSGEPEAPAGQNSQRRDSLGRFVAADQAAQPGEAAPDEGTQPRPEVSAPPAPTPHPAPQGSSSEAPANWSAEDRAQFAKLPAEGQAFLLRRHSEMEGDYQRRVQANAQAAQFTQALAPVFQDPVIAGSLQQAGASPYDAIQQWASFHRRAMDPNPEVRLALHRELGARMGLDPAASGQPSRQGQQMGLSEADLKDPAIRVFADHIGKTLNDVRTLRGELHQMRQAEAQRANAEVMKVTRWSIDSFADEKDERGQLKHPHFDAVLPHLIELYRANPERSLQEAYDLAIWAVPAVRQTLISAERAAVQQQAANERARQAVRSNARGITSPVAKPAAEGGNKPRGLRATLEASADEAGL